MSEGSWPPGARPPQLHGGQHDPRLYDPRQGPYDPRQGPYDPRPYDPRQGPAVRPRLLPPEYQPVHHDPRPGRSRPRGRYPAGSPWRQAQRRPETGQWPAGDQLPPPGWPPDQPGERRPPREEHRDDASTFVPGFGRDDTKDAPARPSARRARPGAPGGAGAPDGSGAPDGGQVPAGPERPGARSRQSPSRAARRSRRRRFRWIAPWAALLVIVVPLAVAGGYGYSLYMSKYHPADYSGDGTGRVVVQVTSGDTPTSLGPELVRLGVVASARAFVLAAEHSSNPAGLLPGFYSLHRHMKASLAYARLLNPADLVQITVTIPEGWRVSQLVAWLGAKSGIPAADYQKVLKDPASLGLPGSANGDPEGYLFPATYEVVPHETALQVLRAMVQRFDQEAAAIDLAAAARQVHLTEGQVITMASLVEAEGGSTADYPKIARVIYNRLAQGIPLQLDSTVLFGLGSYGIIASDSQLQSDSPYNTYRHTGLTPGPIDSPGNAAIEAVLHPAAGNWLYFVTVNPKTGETLFTASQAQFEQFRSELERNLGQG
jgi:UPF0755 protein